jgi:hypothetical protein
LEYRLVSARRNSRQLARHHPRALAARFSDQVLRCNHDAWVIDKADAIAELRALLEANED